MVRTVLLVCALAAAGCGHAPAPRPPTAAERCWERCFPECIRPIRTEYVDCFAVCSKQCSGCSGLEGFERACACAWQYGAGEVPEACKR